MHAPSEPAVCGLAISDEVRQVRASHYFTHDLSRQRDWYSDRAKRFKRRAELLALTVVAAGAASSFLQVFGSVPWLPIVNSLLGAVVVIVEGWRQIARYNERWVGYRSASEKMKREQRLFVNHAGPYGGDRNEDAAFARFVESIETIIAEEQQIFWSKNTGSASNHAGPESRSLPVRQS